MKLTTKLWLLIVGSIALVLIARVWMRAKDDRAQFEADMRQDHVVAARALRAGVGEIWELNEPDRVQHVKHLVERAQADSSLIHFRWLSPIEVREQLSPQEMTDIAADRPIQRIAAPSRADELISYVPVRPGTESLGVLELRESFGEIDRQWNAHVRGLAVALAVTLGFFGFTSMIGGRWLVGRPVEALTAYARRIGGGDLSTPLDLRASQEFCAIAEEMNNMCARLAAAKIEATKAVDARMAALHQLRHAERLATVGRLAAGVAHEIGTPLSIVSGYAQMIYGREVRGDKVLESARIIDVQVGRVAGIVRQLLDFSRQSGPAGGEADAFAVASSVADLLRPSAEKSGVQLSSSGTPIVAAVDQESLRQVVINLVVNALDATPSGGSVGVTVERVQTAPPGREEQRSYARLVVSDTGSGIPDDIRAHMFDPFFTTKPIGAGTGLGLSVVHGIVEDHGGWIEVVTAVGRGTALSAYFPIGSAPS